jgi:hypothetical protein
LGDTFHGSAVLMPGPEAGLVSAGDGPGDGAGVMPLFWGTGSGFGKLACCPRVGSGPVVGPAK